MEMAGLGKLSPNMMLIGFQEKWWACPDDADEYVRTIQSALDLHLSVGVFRIQSGFDLTSIGIMNQNVMRQFDDKLIFVVCFWVWWLRSQSFNPLNARKTFENYCGAEIQTRGRRVWSVNATSVIIDAPLTIKWTSAQRLNLPFVPYQLNLNIQTSVNTFSLLLHFRIGICSKNKNILLILILHLLGLLCFKLKDKEKRNKTKPVWFEPIASGLSCSTTSVHHLVERTFKEMCKRQEIWTWNKKH